MGVDVAGNHLSPVPHGDGGGEGLAAGGGAGVQHPHPRPGIGRRHRQPGGGVLDVKEALLEFLQPLQAPRVAEQEAVGQPGVGLRLHPLAFEGGCQGLRRGFQRVHLGTGGGLPVVGFQQGLRLLPAQPPGKLVRQPLGVAVPGGRIRRLRQGILLPHQTAQHPVDQPGGPGVFGLLPGQGHRLADGGMVWHPIQI